MKGSPMKRNFGIGSTASPAKLTDVYIEDEFGNMVNKGTGPEARALGKEAERFNENRRNYNTDKSDKAAEYDENFNVDSKFDSQNAIMEGEVDNSNVKKTSNVVYTNDDAKHRALAGRGVYSPDTTPGNVVAKLPGGAQGQGYKTSILTGEEGDAYDKEFLEKDGKRDIGSRY